MTDANLHRIASRAIRDVLFGNTNQKRISKKKLTDSKANSENLDHSKDFITHVDSLIVAPMPDSTSTPIPDPVVAPIPDSVFAPIPDSVFTSFSDSVFAPNLAPIPAPNAAPIPAPNAAPIPAPIPSSTPASNYWETSEESFAEQFLKNQQRISYLPKPYYPAQRTNYSSLPALTPNCHWRENDRDEVHQLTSAMSYSINFTPVPKEKVSPNSNSEALQHNHFNKVNTDFYSSYRSKSIASDEVECKPLFGQTDTRSYYASQVFKSEKQWSISDHNDTSKQKTNELCEKFSNDYGSAKVAMEELGVPRSSYIIDGHESPEIPTTPESIQKKVRLEYGYVSSSNKSYNEGVSRIPDDSPVSEPSLNILESSSKHTTPKRRFSEIYDDQQSDDQKLKSATDQTPNSPLTCIPSSQCLRYHGYRPFLPNYNDQELQTISPGVGFVDTHCHLDFLFQRAHHNDSFEAYRKVFKEYFPVSYEGCVAVFCDPFTFARETVWKNIIEEDGVWAAFGCHPHNALDYTENIHSFLITALGHNKVRALGEIGLDYSNRNNCPKAMQHQAFKKQLKLAIEMKLPLVIHNRDAYEDCLEIMKKYVPLNHKIHLHCCTDPWEVAKTFLDTFPNLFIGLTNVITYSSAENVHNIARNIPLNRLLLETDAPYFLPSKLPKSLRWAHPGMAIHVAAQVAVLKRVSLEETLKAVRQNTYNMYGI